MSIEEIRRLAMSVQRRLNVLRMTGEDSTFDYKAPEMEYNKETGDVTIKEGKKQKKRIIRSTDDLLRERAAIQKEMGLEDKPLDEMDLDTTEK